MVNQVMRRPSSLSTFLDRRSGRARSWSAENGAGLGDALMLVALMLRRTLAGAGRAARAVVHRWSIPVGIAMLVWAYLAANASIPVRPHGLSPTDGWWAWYDQGKTLEALQGWRAAAPTPANQWYQPLYPLLGALGAALTPRQPFLIVDLLGLLAGFVLFVPLAGLMGVGRGIATAIFLLIVAADPVVIDDTVIPWNTTVASPLGLLGLLAAAAILSGAPDRRRVPVWSAALGAAAALVPALRPTDELMLLPAVLLCASHLLFAPIAARRRGRIALLSRAATGALAGFLPAAALGLATYLPVFGPHPSPYMIMSRQTGFDPELLLQHWVVLVVGSRPEFPSGQSMIERFWWLAPCLAATIATAVAIASGHLRHRRTVHAAVLGAMVLYWCLYLSYRDINPVGLWAFNNFHYFIWTFPLLGVYGVLGLGLLGRAISSAWKREWRRTAARACPPAIGIIALLAALCWRPQLEPREHPGEPPRLDVAANQVVIPGGLSRIDDALLVSAVDHAGKIYFGDHTLTEGGRVFHDFSDFRAFPLPGGTMVLPLRRLPSADGVLHFDPKVRLDASYPPLLLRQRMVFGLPCWAPRIVRATTCKTQTPLPGPLFPVGHQIDFDSRMEPAFLIPGGWSDQSDGRWTLGYFSSLLFRVPDRAAIGRGVTVEVEGAGFIPRGSEWLHIKVSANDHPLTRWIVSTVNEVALRVVVPADIIPADGRIKLTLSVLNARRPAEVVAGAKDRRLLGFRVRAIRLLPWTPEEPADPGG